MSGRAAYWLGVPAVLAFVVIGAADTDRSAPVGVAVAVIAAALTLAFARTDGWLLFAGTVLVGGCLTVLCTATPSNIGWFGVCVLGGVCVLRGGTLPGIGYATAAVVLFVVEWTVLSSDSGWLAWPVGMVFTTVVCLMARRQSMLIDALRRAQEGLADSARIEERNRIARELHDVIAHSLTVSLLHVTSARLAVDDDPAEAATALEQAEQLTRQSLAEARQAVGLLRQEGAGSATTPLPGTAELPSLVEGFVRAGMSVELRTDGDPTRVGSAVGLAVYRILQEALTNSARHAPGCPVTARLVVSRDECELIVDTPGAHGPASAATGDGVGLHSMRERAESLGGRVVAGPSPHGWRVQACLPVDATRSGVVR